MAQYKVEKKSKVEENKRKQSTFKQAYGSGLTTSRNDPTDYLASTEGGNLTIYFQHIPSGERVSFKAFLRGFADNFESSWNSERVYGRMDPIETFQGTRRSITMEWDVVAFSIEEAKENLAKVDVFTNFLYPVYESVAGGAGSINSAPLLKMKFANLIRQPGATGQVGADVTTGGLVGRIDGLSYEPDFEAGVFREGASNSKLYPQTITMACNFQVFHTHKLGYRRKGRNKIQAASGFPHGEYRNAPNGSKVKESRTDRQRQAAETKVTGGNE